MVYRIYVEKKPGFDGEAQGLKHELVELVGIKGLKALRLLNRYDVEGIDRDLFEKAIPTVFSEPPVDVILYRAAHRQDGVCCGVSARPV